jgi:hypothetical protein
VQRRLAVTSRRFAGVLASTPAFGGKAPPESGISISGFRNAKSFAESLLGRRADGGMDGAVLAGGGRASGRFAAAGSVAVAAFGAAIACVAAGVPACGGSTGRDGLEQPGGGDDGGAGASDATTAFDAGTFDVGIAYVDRSLPEVVVPPEAAVEAGPVYPNCPPFIPVDGTGKPVTPGTEVDQIPSDYAAGGAVVAAADGSACATYGWLGSVAADRCVTSNAAGGIAGLVLLPPCNWVLDAGAARQGSSAGLPRYQVCLALYACILKSGCGSTSVNSCLCGGGSTSLCDGGGPCGAEELAALEYRADEIQDALKNFTDTAPTFPGYGGSALNYVFQAGESNHCFEAGAGGP